MKKRLERTRNIRTVEHPKPMNDFLEETGNLDWSKDKIVESLDKIFMATNNLVYSEIEYYYKQRIHARRISTITRLLAWILGTLGLLAPLIESAIGVTGVNYNLFKWGYVMLALSASFLTANALFDGSAGHIRNVKAQMELERILTMFRFKWYALRSKIADTDVEAHIEDIFNVFSNLGIEVYAVLGNETIEWMAALNEVVNRYEAQLKKASDSEPSRPR